MRFISTSPLLCAFSAALYAASPSSPSQKTVVSLDGPWSVISQGQAASLNVPASLAFFGGVSIWTKNFTLDLVKAPIVSYLEFDGIANTAIVKLNGQQIGILTAFTHSRLDAGGALNPSGSNTLEVDIDDRLTSTTVPGGPIETYVPLIGPAAYALPVAWAPDGGIFRDVNLVYSDHAVITDAWVSQGFTPDFKTATLNFRLKIAGARASDLYGAAGLATGEISEGQCLALQTGADVLDCNISVSSPQLWSPANPVLHDFNAILFDASGVIDTVQDKVGLRKIETAGNRLLLNGQPIFLRGITRHDTYGSHGFAADEPTIRQDFTRMQQLGVNFVRCIHYPPDSRVARIADEMGLLLSEEIPAYAQFQVPAIVSIAENMTIAMIERDYNRASVILWITGNGPVLDITYLGSLATTAALHDSSRPVTFVIDDPNSTTPAKIQEDAALMRNAGMRVYAQNGYWYPYLVNTLVPAMPVDMPVVITEWAGSEGSDRGPIGTPGTQAFPDFKFPDTGIFPESYQAYTIFDALSPWLPYTNCDAIEGQRCISGMTFYNWQDVKWTGMPYFYSGHYDVSYSGLVYEDRAPKQWPQVMFQYVYEMLPR